jgi:squalene-hopene/tetraprenyl-beta-curcumene cyclase
MAVRCAADWMTARFEASDGLGAIFPPIIWSVVALKCLGYSENSPQVRAALGELEALYIREGNTLRLQPCKSPVWDTAIALLALREAGILPDQAPIRKGVRWLLSKEVRRQGDWAVLNGNVDAGGWCFEYNNDFYPDVDDTSMVLMALCRCLPPLGEQLWSAEFLLGEWSPAPADRDAAAIVTARASSSQMAFQDLEGVAPQLKAIWRGARWVLAMQGRDGGWGAFDSNNNRELFTRVPFADHNAMIDPTSTVDLTARMLEMFSDLNLPRTHPAVAKAIDFVWKNQEPDGAWYGRWGVNYIYGTWQSLIGLAGIGIPTSDPRIRRAVAWLERHQQPSGGWGETPRSYDEPHLRGSGPATASQTAWAILGLLAAGEVHSEAVSRGVQYLIDTQRDEGDWEETQFTGTGFPRVFYLKYHLYRVYFPLLALGRYYRLKKRAAEKVEG